MARSTNPGAARPLAREAPRRESPAPRPFLKWVGGKTQLLEQMTPLLPRSWSRYFEPFVGGAALFFDQRTRRPDMPAFLSDVNAELVSCYVAVRDDVDAVLDALDEHVYASDHYYEVRAQRPAELPPAKRAARTIFLNKTGYNGLYRVNRSGQFNVPFGRFTKPLFRDVENLRACSRALRDVSIEHGDFSQVLERAKKGDFVYFDPPYVPVSPTSDFTAYVPGGFGETEQRKLADVFRKLAKRGVHVMLSNSDTPFVRELYQGFAVDEVYASRSVNSNAARRGKLTEVVVRSYAGRGA
ncbi:MAG: DNA adenine methylase [Labilithrix sp.]|nr:DNA adenine methylase [Labilithrix sp.]MCW5835860.1 DNA adenine methylase [Labilithrix sp.]